MKKYQGFTLIELMIVIAILGILIAIALPAYQDYTVRARVSEGVAQTAPAKLAVSETASSVGSLGGVTQANNGFSFSANATDYVASITIANGGTITTTTKSTGADVEPIMTFSPTQSSNTAPVNWVCRTPAASRKYVPAECRN
jgi:type IV pilus assembly protein PilA